ncbi:MAG: urea carboxylase [Terrimicrobiaceae bacterium]
MTAQPTKILIANRGAIACRIEWTIRKLGLSSVAVYSEADADSLHVRNADEAVAIGDSAPASSYLDAAKILNVAKHTGASVVHPGYGFLSENADFAEACEREGVAFAGPTAAQIRQFGLKNSARDVAKACGVPLLPGTDVLQSLEEAGAAAAAIGFPVMLKSTAGGGGIGMQVCHHEGDLRGAYESVRRLGEANFRNGGVFLEKFVEKARHVEVQIFGDGRGHVIALGERDCSAQRRNQKVLEETPAPGLPPAIRKSLGEAAISLGKAVSYRSAGTIEFLYDAQAGAFYFLEVNTRLQVEHGVTEEVFGVDLVEWMLRLALGDDSFLMHFRANPAGVAIEARVYAEMPARNFQPSSGTITFVHIPECLRVETWIDTGTEVSGFYDPMLAKVIAKGATRTEALMALRSGLQQMQVYGVETNLEYLVAILDSHDFQEGGITTSFLNGFEFQPSVIDVLDGGIETLVVDWPGRVGYWDVGVPPSGPFDDLSFRLGNTRLGNHECCAGLEVTVRGPALKFQKSVWICLTGAEMGSTLDGLPLERGIPILACSGQTLRIGEAKAVGLRGYLCVRGGLDEALYLGSRTTFRLGQFGGHGGRALRSGDALRLFDNAGSPPPAWNEPPALPVFDTEWKIGVSYGPHGAPDFFTERDIDQFFQTAWEVHYNSSRTGVRLIGPKPEWARRDGGEAGLHPSNIHDNAYQVGAIDFTGDMPIILGPDGPSLGGFVCPATILSTEFWKVGQLRPGNRVRFHPVALDEATRASAIETIPATREPVIARKNLDQNPGVVYRRQGDSGILVEYGDMVLDLHLRFRVQALYEALRSQNISGLLDLTPGIRSLQVRYDSSRIAYQRVLDLLAGTEVSLPEIGSMVVPTRVVHLPLSWDDESTRIAIEKYSQSVRKDAPWCPSNIEFIRRINGLETQEDVREIVFSASYLVMGLGDVYLGAPVATPLDPRHRLVTTKYNPARTWTPENAVGIGGAYLCIYGMEGPGGYQFVGRTVPVWNRYRQTRSFVKDHPWLLRFFDQIRFYPLGHSELMDLRRDMLTGRYEPKIEEQEFRLADYDRFLETEAESIASFRAKQRAAFDAERERWNVAGKHVVTEIEPMIVPAGDEEIPAGCLAVSSPTAGNLWKVLVEPGQQVAVGETLAIVESMKMEILCVASESGTVERLLAKEGQPVAHGQSLLAITPQG